MPKLIMTNDQVQKAIMRMAFEILEKNAGNSEISLVGIQRRGVNIAKLLKEKLEILLNVGTHNLKKIETGILDITFYRDDLSTISNYPVVNGTNINFPIEGKTIILIDDVLYTGRTIRAAIDGLFEYGRPGKVELCVLIDRGHRELPFSADFVGKILPTSKDEIVKVYIEDLDGETKVEIVKAQFCNL